MKCAVVTASGIGDGLIFLIASYGLMKMGHEVTTYNDHLDQLGQWVEGHVFAKNPGIFFPYDVIILQHDNTPRAKKVRECGKIVYTFYGTHQVAKHGPLGERDYVCDPNRTMVDNIQKAMTQWGFAATAENGLRPPAGLCHRKYPGRIAIHPQSSSPDKNWPQEKFEQVAKWLQTKGFEPFFLVDPQGRPRFSQLEALASFLYESGAFLGNDSGPGHIASCLRIPSLIVAQDERHMRLWAPGWHPPEVVLPPRWTSHWKWTRTKWKKCITVSKVIRGVKKLIDIK